MAHDQLYRMYGCDTWRKLKHVLGDVECTEYKVAIKTAQKVLMLSGRKRTNQGRGGIARTYVDDDSVNIRLGV